MRKRRLLPLALVGLIAGLAGTAPMGAQADSTSPYTTPGGHLVNGRYWKTSCEKYSAKVVRCRTEIWATTIVKNGTRYVQQNQWVFNNLTYLPATRASWGSNNLARNTSWTAADGRKWRTECGTPTTGRNGCRTYVETTVLTRENGRFHNKKMVRLNNMVTFSSAGTPPVTEIPKAAPERWLPSTPKVLNVWETAAPKKKAAPSKGTSQAGTPTGAVGTCKASYYWQGQRTANGERFNPNALTTAHRSYPFGTRLKVTNPSNGKSVIVRVNDRGPFIKGRCLDLSRAAMQQIGGTKAGVITVQYQKVS